MIFKKTTLFALLFITANLLAQKNTGFSFTIEGLIKNSKQKYIYVHHKWDEKDYTDSSKISPDGKFNFKLKSPEPNMYWITLGSSLNAQPNLIFFADAGTLKANLNADSLAYGKIEGGQTQKDYSEYRLVLNNFIISQQRMQQEYSQASQAGDQTKMMQIQQEFQGLNGKYISALKEFIKNHPKSPVSANIIYMDFNNPNVPFEDVVQSLNLLDKSMSNTKFVKLATERVNKIKGTMVGSPATDFTQNTADGKPIKLSSYKGKVVLVDFWASWCRPCRLENPNVVAAYKRYKDKGFTVLGVSFDSNKEAWLNAVAQDELTWQHVSDLKGWGNEVGKTYSISSIPQNILVDKEGVIIAKNLRGEELDAKLAEIFEKK
ncbi:MAG: AhpC/TSA family protein [Bacteroidetes bacterium]|nr:AhpC/TSA family protein [Bacteroidota bacterium]